MFYYSDGIISDEFIDGKILHREDGPAIEEADGTKLWYINGRLHRIGSPAAEWSDGARCWSINNKWHRIDGPAIEEADRSKYWFIDGKQYNEKYFSQIISEAKVLDPILQLTDPRWWVRELASKTL